MQANALRNQGQPYATSAKNRAPARRIVQIYKPASGLGQAWKSHRPDIQAGVRSRPGLELRREAGKSSSAPLRATSSRYISHGRVSARLGMATGGGQVELWSADGGIEEGL